MQSKSRCTVLLIEDDPEQLAFWSSALKTCSAHYSVFEATSGQEGLDLLRHHEVDCVVLDLDLSGSSGFQFLLDLVPDRNRPEIAGIIVRVVDCLALPVGCCDRFMGLLPSCIVDVVQL